MTQLAEPPHCLPYPRISPSASASSEAPTPAPPAPTSSIGTCSLVQAPAPAGFPALLETKLPGSEVPLGLPPNISAGACPSSTPQWNGSVPVEPSPVTMATSELQPELAKYLEAEHGVGPAIAQCRGMSTRHPWLPDTETMSVPPLSPSGELPAEKAHRAGSWGRGWKPWPAPAPAAINVSRRPPCDPESRNSVWIWVSPPCQRAGGAS